MQMRFIVAGVAVLTLMQWPAAAQSPPEQRSEESLAAFANEWIHKYSDMQKEKNQWEEKTHNLEHEIQNMDRETQQFMPGWHLDRKPSEQQNGRWGRRRPEAQDD